LKNPVCDPSTDHDIGVLDGRESRKAQKMGPVYVRNGFGAKCIVEVE